MAKLMHADISMAGTQASFRRGREAGAVPLDGRDEACSKALFTGAAFSSRVDA